MVEGEVTMAEVVHREMVLQREEPTREPECLVARGNCQRVQLSAQTRSVAVNDDPAVRNA